MDTYTTILYEVKGAVCYITLNRAEKKNAINREMAAELLSAFRRVRDESAVGVVVLAGEGKSFCTGGDLSVFPSLCEHQSSLNWLAHDGYDINKAIEQCEKVVVAKIKGYCLAGGLELALMCDLIYACETAKFGTTEINMGILPGWGGTVRVGRSLPGFRAREIIFSGRKDYPAREMFEMGFLTRVLPDETFDGDFEAVVANLAVKKPIALRMAKEVMAKSLECGSIDAALTVERNAIQWLVYAPDIQAVMEGFRKKPEDLVKQQRDANIASDVKKEG
jgi:enoyl-CoA hydratase/carnithine racemase